MAHYPCVPQMNLWRWGPLIALVSAVALGGCGKSSGTDGMPECTQLRACGSSAPVASTPVPSGHRAAAQACNPTPADAMSADECLTDDDCPSGGVCVCSSPIGNSAIVNRNYCARGNCRVDGDCGVDGYCLASLGFCGVDGFFCHTPADTCVDAAKDCGPPCAGGCHYFQDKGAFACLAAICGGC